MARTAASFPILYREPAASKLQLLQGNISRAQSRITGRGIIAAMAETDPLTSQLKAAGVDRAEVLGRLTRSRLLRRAAIAVGVVVAVVLAIVELPGLHEVRARFAHADPGWILVAVVMEAASIACFTLALQRTFKERLAPRSAISVGTTAQGVNAVVPAGGTAGFAFAAVILTDAGLPVAWTVGRLIALFLITSVLTNLVLVMLGGGGAAVGVLAARGSVAASVVPAAIALALLVASARARTAASNSNVLPKGLWAT